MKNIFKKIKNLYFFHIEIKRNEFHESLDLNIEHYGSLSKEDRERYLKELMRKRNLAHDMDIKEF